MRLPAYVTEAIDAAVAKGAQRLDVRRPSWYTDIDLRTLDMADSCACICGQLYGEYGRPAVEKVVGGWVHGVTRWWSTAERYGFDMPPVVDKWIDDAPVFLAPRSTACWNRLERAWKEQIKARIAAEAV